MLITRLVMSAMVLYAKLTFADHHHHHDHHDWWEDDEEWCDAMSSACLRCHDHCHVHHNGLRGLQEHEHEKDWSGQGYGSGPNGFVHHVIDHVAGTGNPWDHPWHNPN